MKLLLISVQSTVTRGGIAVWTDHFLNACEKQNIDCTLVNTEVIGSRVDSGRRNFLDEITRTRRIFRDLKSALKAGSFDVAHLNTSCGNFGLFRDYLVARRLNRAGIPVVTHYHCDIPFWIHNGLSRRFLKKLAMCSKANLVLCENSRRYMENLGMESVKVPNFLSEDLIRSEEKPIREKLERIFFVGRVSVAKGAREMYELAKRFPEITFELLGDVVGDVTTWEVPANVLLPGGKPHGEVMARLDEADLFLFPSHSEGFSVALMESMARGVPAVATDVGANADMLSEGCGMVVPVKDVDAMEKAIRELRDPKLRTKISRKALERVSTAYTTDGVMAQIKAAYTGGTT